MAGRIVVGIDGSPPSARALDWAAARAALGGQKLELVNAYNLPVDFTFYGYQSYAASAPLDWFTEHSRALLDSAEAHVREIAPDVTCTLTSDLGPPATLLAAAARDADAVVVGRRGLGTATSALLGSVSNRITTEADCPVIVVGETELPTTGPIVVGVDGSEYAAAALRYAVGEAALRHTSVRAVTAHEGPPLALSSDPELMARMHAAVSAEAAVVAAEALDDLVGGPVEVEKVIVEGRPGRAVLDHAGDAQLIVVGSHGKGFVRRVLLGSVSREVLQDADRPVAVVDVIAAQSS